MLGGGLLPFLLCLATPNLITAANSSAHQLPAIANTASSKKNTPAPEPGPFWPEAKQQWGVTWELHWVGLGITFALLAFRSLWVIIRSPDANSRFARRNLFYAINWLLLALGITRSLYLFIDPYESGENIANCPLWIVRPLFGIAFPCLMSAYCLVHVAFLEVTKIQVISPRLRSLRFVGSIIFVHFAVVIVSDTTVAIEADRTELLIVCQSFFIVWGLLNSICFIYSGTRVVMKNRKIRNRICEMENSEWKLHALQSNSANSLAAVKENHSCENKQIARQVNAPKSDHNRSGRGVAYTIQPIGFGNNLTVGVQGAKQIGSNHEPRTAKLRKRSSTSTVPTCRERAVHKIAVIAIWTSVLSMSCCALQLYSLFGVHGAYSRIVSPKPWPWLAFQTSFRLVELIMAFMLSFCVLRSDVGWRRGINQFFSPRRTRKTQPPRIIVVQVKDAT